MRQNITTSQTRTIRLSMAMMDVRDGTIVVQGSHTHEASDVEVVCARVMGSR